jgi:YbbR domain-containing protein
VRSIVGRIVHNWPLKLAAVGLATILYGGLALSQNTQSYQGVIPVRQVNDPPQTYVLTPPPPVTLVRYFAPTGVPVAASSFLATIDLETFGDSVGVVSVPISVTSPDPRIRILGFEPTYATIELDTLVSVDDIPVRVVHGEVPDGLTLGTTTVNPETVTVSGPASIVSKVDAVRADVAIGATGIDVDEDVTLLPIDKLGNALRPLDVTPPTARVRIAVFSDRQTRALPVDPVISGEPAPGFEIASVTVSPSVVLVAGDADRLAETSRIDTTVISISGLSQGETVTAGLDLPEGITAVDETTVTVTIALRPVTATRTFEAGIRLIGADGSLTYSISTDQVLLTAGGSPADLDGLAGAAVVADLDVTGLAPGDHDVQVTAELPAGVTLVAASPATVKVTISGPGAAASPTAQAGPSAAASAGG